MAAKCERWAWETMSARSLAQMWALRVWLYTIDSIRRAATGTAAEAAVGITLPSL